MYKTAAHHDALGYGLFEELMEKEAAKTDILDKIYRGLRAEAKTLRAARDAGEDVADAIAKNRAARRRASMMRHRVENHDRMMRNRYTATYEPNAVYKVRHQETDALGRVKGKDGVRRPLSPRSSNKDPGVGRMRDLPDLNTPAGRLEAQRAYMNEAGAYYSDGKWLANVHPGGQTTISTGRMGDTTRSTFENHLLPQIRSHQEAGRKVTWRKRMGRTHAYHAPEEKLTGYM